MKEGNLSRRTMLTGGAAAVLTSIPGTDAVAKMLVGERQLAKEIHALHMDCSKGGGYYRALHSRPVSPHILKELAKRLRRVSDELRILHFKPDAEAEPETREFVLSKDVPGLLTASVETFKSKQMPDGTRMPLKKFCNFFVFHALGADYVGTANHCVQNTVAQKSFYSNPQKGDVAVHRLSGRYTGSALSLDARTTNDTVSGFLGITLGTKNGIADAFYGPLMKMSDAMYDIVSEGETIDEPLATQIRRGFWKVIPEEQGNVERIVDGEKTLKAQGRSGSIELAYDTRKKGYIPAGVFIAVKKFSHGPLAGQTLGFYSGPDDLLSIIEEERGDVPDATRSSEWVGRAR